MTDHDGGMSHTPVPADVSIARHLPTSQVLRYDEETCDGRAEDGTRTITLLNLLSDGEAMTVPASDVQIVSYEDALC